jgi:hypothetical protein
MRLFQKSAILEPAKERFIRELSIRIAETYKSQKKYRHSSQVAAKGHTYPIESDFQLGIAAYATESSTGRMKY